jgi:hypothetical protein
MALALLNESSSSDTASTIMLDCGCCGWTTLLAMAAELILHPSSKMPFQKNHLNSALSLQDFHFWNQNHLLDIQQVSLNGFATTFLIFCFMERTTVIMIDK